MTGKEVTPFDYMSSSPDRYTTKGVCQRKPTENDICRNYTLG